MSRAVGFFLALAVLSPLAIVLGRDWATATVGAQLTLTSAWSGLTSFTAQLGQDHATVFGGLIGLNYALGEVPPRVSRN